MKYSYSFLLIFLFHTFIFADVNQRDTAPTRGADLAATKIYVAGDPCEKELRELRNTEAKLFCLQDKRFVSEGKRISDSEGIPRYTSANEMTIVKETASSVYCCRKKY